MNSYAPLLVMITAAAAFSIDGLAMSSFLGPKRHSRVRLENCEHSVEATPVASGRGCFPIRYYLTTITFIVFDTEVVFLYPWTVSFHKPGLFGVVVMLSFVLLIAVPFAYERRRGGLERD